MKGFAFSLMAAAVLAAGAANAQQTRLLAGGEGSAPIFEAAFGIGVMGLDKDRTGIDESGIAGNLSFRFGTDTVPVGLEWRMYAASFDLDDDEYVNEDGRRLRDTDYEIAGGDLSVLLNFNRSGMVNPYLGAGVFYESVSVEAEECHGHHHHHYHTTWDDDGATYIVRAGIDVRSDALFVRADAGYIGEVYDSDDHGQFLINGDIGVAIIPQLRVDAFGHYFTEYKSFYFGVGVTVCL